MASLEERPNGSVRVVWRIPGETRRQSLTAPTRAAAEALQAIVEENDGNLTREDVGRLVAADPRSGPSVLDWVHAYIDTLASVEAKTVADYHRQATTYMDTLTMPLAALERPDVRAWVNRLSKKVAPKTVANVHGLLSAAMAEAVAQRKRADNPCVGTRLPRRDSHTDDGEQTFLTPAEYDAIDALLPEEYRALPRVTIRTGMRWSEVTALRVGQVHLDATPPTVAVTAAWKIQPDFSRRLGPPKTKKGRRVIELDQRTVDELRPLVAGKAPGDLVFTSHRDPTQPVAGSTFWRHWNRAIRSTVVCEACRSDEALAAAWAAGDREPCGHAGTKVPRFHDLRHSHVAWLIEGGIDITVISRRLGHETISTTFDTYGHLLPTSGEKVIAALDGI